MKAKNKAKELVDKFDNTLTYLESKSKSKECALISCDEVIKVLEDASNSEVSYIYEVAYWDEVKFEIEKL